MEQTFGARSGIIEDIQSRALSSDQSSPAANVQIKGKGGRLRNRTSNEGGFNWKKAGLRAAAPGVNEERIKS